MTIASIKPDTPDIVVADNLSPHIRNIVTLSRPYGTIILLYEDDFSDTILGAWAEQDRLSVKTRQVGVTPYGIEVHVFGMDPFAPGTKIELHIREASGDVARQDPQRTAYKSLLNELALISVRIYMPSDNDGRPSR